MELSTLLKKSTHYSIKADISGLIEGYTQINIIDELGNPDFLDVDAISLVNDDVMSSFYGEKEMDLWAYFNEHTICELSDGKIVLSKLKDSAGESHYALMLIKTTSYSSFLFNSSEQCYNLLIKLHGYEYDHIFENFGTPDFELRIA